MAYVKEGLRGLPEQPELELPPDVLLEEATGMTGIENLSVPTPVAREGESPDGQLAVIRLRGAAGRSSWRSTSELEFPDPYTLLAVEAHYGDLLEEQLTKHSQRAALEADLGHLTAAPLLTCGRSANGAWVVGPSGVSLEERLGRILVAYELLKDEAQTVDRDVDNGRVPLDRFADLDLADLVGPGERLEFAYVLSVFRDSEGAPSGWSYRATAKPNAFELLGVLAVEIDELKEAIRDREG